MKKYENQKSQFSKNLIQKTQTKHTDYFSYFYI